MTWRGSTDFKDRIFASLPYLIPLFYAIPFGRFLFSQFPVLKLILIPLIPLEIIYSVPFAGIAVFFILFLAVVRNPRVAHFIRFNTMQAILLDIIIILCGLLLPILLEGLGTNLLTETLYNIVFLGTLFACGYSIVQSCLGLYAEIPGISEAVYQQVR
ncbi:MAG: hypothetical protein F6K47_19100 [Symploca sp. SIO2E6]|nr:hypothetical protein [Symploca sp. SIO2E6]